MQIYFIKYISPVNSFLRKEKTFFDPDRVHAYGAGREPGCHAGCPSDVKSPRDRSDPGSFHMKGRRARGLT